MFWKLGNIFHHDFEDFIQWILHVQNKMQHLLNSEHKMKQQSA